MGRVGPRGATRDASGGHRAYVIPAGVTVARRWTAERMTLSLGPALRQPGGTRWYRMVACVGRRWRLSDAMDHRPWRVARMDGARISALWQCARDVVRTGEVVGGSGAVARALGVLKFDELPCYTGAAPIDGLLSS